MAKRVYKEKVYPLETQISIARSIVMQNEAAVAEAKQSLASGHSFGGHAFSAVQIEQAEKIVAQREVWLTEARAKLAKLEAQQAA